MTIAERASGTLAAIRSQRPRIHCITNNAAHVLTANMLLAAGAVPSLTTARDEVSEFVRGADALLVNIGTLDEARLAAIDLAVEAARQKGIPWLLDPVFCDRSEARAGLAVRLAGMGPAIVRANAVEVDVLSGRLDVATLDELATRCGCVVVRSGPQDAVTDGSRRAAIGNGHELMGQTTAVGCSGTAVLAAFAAVDADPFMAAAGGMLAVGIAGELAARHAAGPGTFVAHMIDALAALDGATLAASARIE